MALLTILEYPDPRLRTRAAAVTVFDAGFQRLVDDMFETMYAAPGIGLAASQVNVHLRLIVIDVSKDNSEPLVFVNPEILAKQGVEKTEEGCLSLYSDVAEYKADRDHIAILERFNFPHEVLTGARLRTLEPEISDKIGMAVLFPQNRSMRDPYRLVVRLFERFTALGGQMEKGEVVSFTRNSGITGVKLRDGRTIAADEVVICAGAHSATLAKMLGEPIPLETERGYHTQIMSPGIALKHSIIWPARAFMVTPTAGGIRVGGTVEMAGLDAPPDYRRSKITVKRTREALPNLRCENFTEWMGHRPAFPDTVPVMSASAKTNGLFYATGHGHLGLTYAATNARLMADLITGMTPPIDMRPYRIDRF